MTILNTDLMTPVSLISYGVPPRYFESTTIPKQAPKHAEIIPDLINEAF